MRDRSQATQRAGEILTEGSGQVHADPPSSDVIERRDADFFEPPRRILVQQARDQRLIGQALGQRALLDRLQVLAR